MNTPSKSKKTPNVTLGQQSDLETMVFRAGQFLRLKCPGSLDVEA